MEQISFSAFKKATHHVPVTFTNVKNADGSERTYESNKFYINKDYKSNMFWMPRFGLGSDNIFYKIDDKNFVAVSELSKTKFIITEEEE